MPAIEALATELKGQVTVVKLDLTLLFNKTVQQEFGINSLPTYLVYRDGQEIARLSGPEHAQVSQVRAALQNALAATNHTEDSTP